MKGKHGERTNSPTLESKRRIISEALSEMKFNFVLSGRAYPIRPLLPFLTQQFPRMPSSHFPSQISPASITPITGDCGSYFDGRRKMEGCRYLYLNITSGSSIKAFISFCERAGMDPSLEETAVFMDVQMF